MTLILVATRQDGSSSEPPVTPDLAQPPHGLLGWGLSRLPDATVSGG